MSTLTYLTTPPLITMELRINASLNTPLVVLNLSDVAVLSETPQVSFQTSETTTPLPTALYILPGIWQDALTPAVWHSFQAFHTILTILSLLSNCLTLVVIYGIVTHLTPILQLVTSLGFSSMLAPWAVMTLYFPASACQDEIHSALLLTGHNAASLTFMVLAICHYIATFKPLQYERIMGQKRLWVVINLIWMTSIIGAHIHFLGVLTHLHPELTFCMQVLANTDMALTLSAAITAAMSTISILTYFRIYIHLRPVHNFALAATSDNQPVEPRKSLVSVITAMALTGYFLLCWVPYLIVKFIQVEALLFDNRTVLLALAIFQTLILTFTFISPIYICLRMQSLQTGYMTLNQKWHSWSLGVWQRIRKVKTRDDIPSTPLNPIESIC